MYPHLHTSGSLPLSYIYSGYEHYYSKDSWAADDAGAWSSLYPLPPRSSSLPETAVNPKVTILPPQPILVSDIDTPSSISSHTLLTPTSPFAQHDVDEVELHAMEFDEFDCNDDEDFIDSDFADEMEGIDEADQGSSPLYGVSAPHVVKSTSALEGALGDTPLSSYGTNLGVVTPADRRLSASVPGFPSTSHRSTGPHQRWPEKAHSPTLATSSPAPGVSYPSQHVYIQRNDSSSTSLFAPTSPSLYNHLSSSSLASAFASSSSVRSPHASRPTSLPLPLPILQPQPIRPIPPIPLADLTSSANESSSSPEPRTRGSPPLSPLPLLCQPVSDAVRYQFKDEPPASDAMDDICYDEDDASESMCEDLIVTESEIGQFVQQRLAFCQGHPSTGGTCAMEGKLFPCGYTDVPIRWQ
ncbi:hypothetical protein HD554DRAFT_2170387 [Boletus coccyginus]|nr:hypothetical protein HD554DRAFT_2170387 [Boletus coccyginus]